MGKSLQEQLLQSGLAKPKQAKKARREKTRQDQQARREAKPAAETDALAREIEAREADKRARDRELNARRRSEREARERDAAAAQLIETHRIAPVNDDHSVPYNYRLGRKIKRLRVSEDQRRQLAAGRLAIVHHRERASLVDIATAERLAALIPTRLWRAEPAEERPDPDDPYADYVVPDDLMW